MKDWVKDGLIGIVVFYTLGIFISGITLMASLASIGNSHAKFPSIIQFMLTSRFMPFVIALKIRNLFGMVDGLVTIWLVLVISVLYFLIIGFIIGTVMGIIIRKVKVLVKKYILKGF